MTTVTTKQLAHSLQRLLDAQRELDSAEEIGEGYTADRHEAAVDALRVAERAADDVLLAYYAECVEVEHVAEQQQMAGSGAVFV
jgi:hypothetical protein